MIFFYQSYEFSSKLSIFSTLTLMNFHQLNGFLSKQGNFPQLQPQSQHQPQLNLNHNFNSIWLWHKSNPILFPYSYSQENKHNQSSTILKDPLLPTKLFTNQKYHKTCCRYLCNTVISSPKLQRKFTKKVNSNNNLLPISRKSSHIYLS